MIKVPMFRQRGPPAPRDGSSKRPVHNDFPGTKAYSLLAGKLAVANPKDPIASTKIDTACD